jgi:hypothetical protein
LMTAPPMFLEFDWTSNAYCSHLGGEFEHSFETLAAARRDLRLIGLRLGTKTDPRTWRIETTPQTEVVGAAIRYRERTFAVVRWVRER